MNRRQFFKALSSILFTKAITSGLRAESAGESITPPSVVDIHMHLLGTSQRNGCFVSDAYRKTLVYRFMSFVVDVNRDHTPAEQDREYVSNLVSLFEASPAHRYGVLLAMDGVYDSAGNLDRKRTPIYVPNGYLFDVCREHEKLVPGASVNPLRKDAMNELDRISEEGAVLVKWIPNSQNINPSDKQIIPFYRRLREFNLPLLTHGGPEYAVPSIEQSYGDPALLKPALEEGVHVIVAHCAGHGVDRQGSYFYRFLDMLDEYPNLYGDISSLRLIHKTRRLRYLLDHPDLFERIYYGSDFPLQFFPATSPLYFLGELSVKEAWRIQEISNVFVRDIATLKALDIPDECFERGMMFVNRA